MKNYKVMMFKFSNRKGTMVEKPIDLFFPIEYSKLEDATALARMHWLNFLEQTEDEDVMCYYEDTYEGNKAFVVLMRKRYYYVFVGM